MRFYLASRYSRREELCQYRKVLENMGHTVTSQWLNGSHQISESQDGDSGADDERTVALRQEYGMEDLRDVCAADVLIAFTEAPRCGPTRGGRHVEMGLAMGRGIPVMICGPRENIFCWLPGLPWFADFNTLMQHIRPA